MEVLRIVLLGKRGAGKSSAGNTLLGTKPFYIAPSSQWVTQASSMSTSTVDGHKIYVVDTPGWTDLCLIEAEPIQEIVKCIDLTDPGPHVLLFVLSIGRFTKEETNTAQQILEVFGEEANKYMMVLFTKGDDLEEKTIEEYLEGVHPDLKNVIEVCGGRYHVFNNRDKENREQVSTLLKKIKGMVEENEGTYYTKTVFQKMAEKLEKKQNIQKTLMSMTDEICKAHMRGSDLKSNDKSTDRNKGKNGGDMKHEDSDRAKEREPKPCRQKGEGENTTMVKSEDGKSGCENDSNQEDMGEKRNKELRELELKWQQRIEGIEEKWSKTKAELQEEILKLQTKVNEQATELDNVKKLQQYKSLRQEDRQQKEENEQNLKTTKQKTATPQKDLPNLKE